MAECVGCEAIYFMIIIIEIITVFHNEAFSLSVDASEEVQRNYIVSMGNSVKYSFRYM